MREIPPEDEKPKKQWFSSSPRPNPKPDPKPKPKPAEPRTPERERRQVKLVEKLRSRSQSQPAKKGSIDGGWGCIFVILIILFGCIFLR